MPVSRGISQLSTSTNSSKSSRRYREETHLIPTPGANGQKPNQHVPWPLETWKPLGLAVFMIIVGIACEVSLAISRRNNGFPVPATNVFDFAQPSFLTSFFPTLFVFPIAYFWGVTDLVLRWYQPYVALSQGGARADESVLADYLMSNLAISMFKSVRRKEWLLVVSMVTALVVNLYQPLAGSLLTIRQLPQTQLHTVTSQTALGLAPDVSTLNAFLAAAGYTEAAAFQGLPDPPFIMGAWATSQFFIETNAGLDASINIARDAVRMNPNCSAPPTVTLDTSNVGNYTITATEKDGCTSTSSFNPASSDQQYGTTATKPGTCGFDLSTDVSFLPIMFWFYRTQTNGTGQAAAVICRPTLQLFNVTATVTLNNGSLTQVTIDSNYTQPNNISGDPLQGKAYNAVLFNSTGMSDFVQARAVAIQSQIPGAIFRFATQTGLDMAFTSPTDILSITENIYSQHLAVSAKSVYFINERSNPTGQLTALVERLVVDVLAAHGLAITMILVGLFGIATHVAHRRMRRALFLTAPPGTIAAVLALTSHSGFGALLYPYDSERAMAAKLAALRFSLDPRTGAIVADQYEYDDAPRDEDAEKVELHALGSETTLIQGVRYARATPPSGSGAGAGQPYEQVSRHSPPRTPFSS